MSIIIPANTLAAAGGFDVDNSCMFNDDDSAYMHITPDSDGSRVAWTFSTWIKRCALGAMPIFSTPGNNSNIYDEFYFNASDKIQFSAVVSGTQYALRTKRVFRDTSAWYHIVLIFDSNNSTAGNRMQLWINGVRTAEGDFEDITFKDAQNYNSSTNKSGYIIYLGRVTTNTAGYYDGYMSEVVFQNAAVDSPVDKFGEFDEDSGIWKPIKVSGLTFGTNGFYLDFKASGNLGNDANGGTDLTEVNLAATDQSTDTCTNNFATLNPLHSIGAASELSQGNLEYDPAGHHRIISTIAPTSGKWYAEVKGIDNPDKFNAGVAHYPMPANGSASSFAFGQGVNADVGRFANDFGVKANGDYGNSNSYSSYMASLESENNNIVGIYLDLDNYKIYFSKNGTLVSSTGKNLTNNGEPYGFISVGEAATFQWNFGNPSFALANTAITDDNGFGAFEYSPNITGDSAAKKFYALCTKNLAEFG